MSQPPEFSIKFSSLLLASQIYNSHTLAYLLQLDCWCLHQSCDNNLPCVVHIIILLHNTDFIL